MEYQTLIKIGLKQIIYSKKADFLKAQDKLNKAKQLNVKTNNIINSKEKNKTLSELEEMMTLNKS